MIRIIFFSLHFQFKYSELSFTKKKQYTYAIQIEVRMNVAKSFSSYEKKKSTTRMTEFDISL